MNDQNMSGPNDYLARLGLNSDPFSAEVDAEFYYENPELMQRLDMIQHLIGFSNQMIFVSGPHGIGKTAMLDRLEYYAPEHWRICRIEANPLMNTPTLLKQLASGFGVEVHSENDDLFETYSNALQDHVSQLERAMHVPVVLIDNAHELPVDAFILLFGFMQQDSQAHLKMALFCEPQIKTMLDSPQLRVLSDQIVHHLDIPELNESRTKEYLEKRLQFAGLEGEFPFLPDTLRRIHRLSEGIPAQVNTLAEQALLDEDSQTTPIVDEVLAVSEEDLDDTTTEQAPIGRRFQSWQIGAVAVVMALLAAVLWITSKLNDDQLPAIAEDVPLDIEEPVEEEVLPSTETLKTEEIVQTPVEQPIDPTEQTPETRLAQEETADLLSEPEIPISPDTTPESFEETAQQIENPDQIDPQTLDPMDALVEELEAAHKANALAKEAEELEARQKEERPEEVATTETPTAPDTEEVSAVKESPKEPEMTNEAPPAEEKVATLEEIKTVTPITATPAVPETPQALDPVNTSATISNDPLTNIKTSAWIQQQPDNFVFLQLLGTHDMDALRKFFAENEVADNTAWYITEHLGEPWYVVVQGPYENRQVASEMRSSLPEAFRVRKPFPKSVAKVKEGMVVE